MRVPAALGACSSPFKSRHPRCSSSALPCSCAALWPRRASIPGSAPPMPSSLASRTKRRAVPCSKPCGANRRSPRSRRRGRAPWARGVPPWRKLLPPLTLPPPLKLRRTRRKADKAPLAEDTRGKSTVGYKFVSPEFFNVLGIDIVRGRGFAPTERSASVAVAVVSESAARQLWPDRDSLGQVLRLEPDPSSEALRPGEPPLLSRTFVVVGIARDVAGLRFVPSKEAVVYVPIDADVAGTSLSMRVHGDPERARRALVERLTAIDPSLAEVLTLRFIARMASYLLELAFWLTLALGALALLLTLSGLFSVLSYLVEQRTREIGVRMALGATSRSIGTLVLSQSARPVGIGLLLGGSLTAALGAALLATPAAELIGSVVRLFDPVAYAASLLCIVIACACAALIPALRAGRIDPIATLRQD